MNRFYNPVRCLDTGIVYRSVTEAARATGVNRASIANSIRNGWRCGGHRWEYAEEMRRLVLCVDTGQTYRSLREAADAYHIDESAIGNAIRQGRPCCGLVFQWVDPLAQEGAA